MVVCRDIGAVHRMTGEVDVGLVLVRVVLLGAGDVAITILARDRATALMAMVHTAIVIRASMKIRMLRLCKWLISWSLLLVLMVMSPICVAYS